MEFKYKLASIVKTNDYDLVKAQGKDAEERERERIQKKQQKNNYEKQEKEKPMMFALKINDITKPK
jgi:hypothetical protein